MEKSINNYNENYDTEEIFQDSLQEAQELMKDKGKIDKLLKRLERKLHGIPKLGDALTYIPKMGMLVNSYFRGDYTEVPVGIITAIIGVLVYFVSPIDAIPDCIPGVGYLDDAAVASGSLYLVKNDLDEYMAWRIRIGLDEDNILEEDETEDE